MKKIFLIAIIITIMASVAYAQDVRPYIARTGGGTGALDSTTISILEDGDRAVVLASDGTYNYIFNASSTDAEDDPWRIRPDDYSTSGVYEKIPEYGYIQLVAPHLAGPGLSAGLSSDQTQEYYGQALFDSGVDVATNYVEYRLEVPRVLDPNVDLVAWFKFRLTGTDNTDHEYVISMDSSADSADYTGTPANSINLSYTPDATGADGDIETAGGDDLTGWTTSLVPGELWLIRLARNGDNDSSIVDSYSSMLIIRYGK